MEKNKRIFELIDKFATLENNWDGDNALAPSKNTINRIIEIANTIDAKGVNIYHTSAGANGEILLDIRNIQDKERGIKIIIYDEREVVVKFQMKRYMKQEDFNFENIDELLQWVENPEI